MHVIFLIYHIYLLSNFLIWQNSCWRQRKFNLNTAQEYQLHPNFENRVNPPPSILQHLLLIFHPALLVCHLHPFSPPPHYPPSICPLSLSFFAIHFSAPSPSFFIFQSIPHLLGKSKLNPIGCNKLITLGSIAGQHYVRMCVCVLKQNHENVYLSWSDENLIWWEFVFFVCFFYFEMYCSLSPTLHKMTWTLLHFKLEANMSYETVKSWNC